MPTKELSADEFERHRPQLQRVASRLLGSHTDAQDAVQETWIRAQRADTSDVENIGGWLTMVTARISLNLLRTRRTHPEAVLDVHIPDPFVISDNGNPEQEAELADSVGLAMLVVLETLRPPERLAFVLHDMFAVPFDEIALMLGRSPAATRQLASRARKQVQDAPTPTGDHAGRRRVVDAFYAAARSGEFDALVGLLDPHVVLHTDSGRLGGIVRGAEAVANQAIRFSLPHAALHPLLVDGTTAVLVEVKRRPIALMGFTVVADHIVEIDVINDPGRLLALGLSGR